jgi:pseudouridine-5'-phosphate glycosidase
VPLLCAFSVADIASSKHICLAIHSHCQVLDIPRTLEYLETQGVCVAAYGADEFPAFFSRHSGCKAPCRVDTPQQ